MVYPYYNSYMPYPYGINTGGLVGNFLIPALTQLITNKQSRPTSYSRLFPETTQPVESDLRPIKLESEVNLPTGEEPALKTPTVGSVLPQSITPLVDLVSPASNYIFPTLTSNKISSGFGNRKAPLPGASTFHQGIDIAGKIGDPLRAAVAGTILEVGSNPKIGNYLKMLGDTGETFTYGHAKSFRAKKGQKVKAGDLLGLLGNTGNSTGAHVHFMASKNGKYFNPMDLYGVNYDK